MVIYIICTIGWNKYFEVNGLEGMCTTLYLLMNKRQRWYTVESPKKSCTRPVP